VVDWVESGSASGSLRVVVVRQLSHVRLCERTCVSSRGGVEAAACGGPVRVMLQAQPSDDELAELRGAVLQQVDVNRDGKIELGEFARYRHDTIRYDTIYYRAVNSQ